MTLSNGPGTDRPVAADASSGRWATVVSAAILFIVIQATFSLIDIGHRVGLSGLAEAVLDAATVSFAALCALVLAARSQPAAPGIGILERWIAPAVSLAAIMATVDFMSHTVIGDEGHQHGVVAVAVESLLLAATLALALRWLLYIRRVGAVADGCAGRASSRRIVLTSAVAVVTLFATVQFSTSLISYRDERRLDGFDGLIELAVRHQMVTERITRHVRSLRGGTTADTGKALSSMAQAAGELRGEAVVLGAALHDVEAGNGSAADDLLAVFELVAARRVALLAEVDLMISGKSSDRGAIKARADAMLASTSSAVEEIRSYVKASRDNALAWKSFWLAFGPSMLIALGLASLVPVASLVGRQEAALVRRAADLEEHAFVLRHSPCAVAVWGADRRISWANAAFERIVGRSQEDVVGRTAEEVFLSDDLDLRLKVDFDAALSAGRSLRIELPAHHANGTVTWLDLLVEPRLADSGTLVGWIAIASDVTEQVGLRRHLRTVFNASASGIIVQDSDGTIVDANPEAERLLGLSREAMTSRSSSDPRWRAIDVDGNTLRGEDQAAMVALRTGDPQFGVTMGVELPDGRRRWLLVNARRDTDPNSGRPFVVSSFNDVTADRELQAGIAEAHRQAEAALAELGAYRAGLDNHSIVAMTDRRGRIVYANELFCQTSGYSRDELIGSTHALLNSGHHDRAFFAEMWRTIASGHIWRGEICNRAKAGTLYWVDSTIVPIRGSDGAIESFVAIRTDITARKAFERSIMESERRLASVIDGTGVGTWEWNIQTGETAINEKWAAIIGFTVSELGPLTVDTWLDRVHPADRPRVDDVLARHFAGELESYDIEVRLRHRDGRWVWVHDRGKVATRTPDGLPLLMAGTHQDISARKTAEDDLRRTHAQMRSVIDSFPGGIVFVDSDLRILGYNENYLTLQDLPTDLVANGTATLVDVFRHNATRGEYGPGDIEALVEERRRRALYTEPHVFERTRPNGRTLEIRGMPMPAGGFVTTYTDVTDRIGTRRLIEEQSRLAEQKSRELQITMEHMNEGLSVFDPDGCLVTWNPQFLSLYGFSDADVTVRMPMRAIVDLHVSRADAPPDPSALIESIRAGRKHHEVVRLASGRVVAVVSSPTPDGGWVATHEDVTEREKAAERIAFAAHHDVLTGLANRAGLKAMLGDALEGALAAGSSFSVLLIDLDRFKAVNDTFGHAVGDKLLQMVADRMRANVRDVDLIARLGGDEFALYFAATPDQTDATIVIATRLLAALSAPYSIDGCQLSVGASIGLAIAPEHGRDLDTLMRNADSALYEVKAAGRNAFRIFDDQLALEARERRELENDLREALREDQLELYYQPIVSVPDRAVVGMEALLRWHHPRRGLVPPDVFVPIAEQTGQIGSIGAWIIRTACRDAATWPTGIRVAVNVSPAQLGQLDFVDTVTRELVRSKLDPARLELEVTETVLLGNDDSILGDLHQLRSLGVRIALDDFGTGYSSLSYLRLFPFDKIKIDRSFVREIEHSPHCSAIVVAVAGLARSLGISTTAEGVETEEQFTLLAAAGCATVQGYLFGQPRAIGAFDLDEPVQIARRA